MVLKLFPVSLLLVVLFSCAQSEKVDESDRGYHVKIGDTVSNIDFSFPDGSVMSLYDLKGKVVILQFTASWCSVCRKEMPFLEEEVWQKHKDDDFIFIGVDYDESAEKVVAFKEKMKITYPMALDPNGEIFLKFSYKNTGVTRNVIIDRDGKIAYLTRLFDREEFDEMKKKIEELLK